MKPRIFIGSSAEALDICEHIQLALERDAIVTPWNVSFLASSTTLDSLRTTLGENDFGIFVFAPDDNSSIRAKELVVARDNVVFEAGMFMGIHGRSKTFVVVPRNVPGFHMPTDFQGFTAISYDPADFAKSPTATVGPIVTKVKQAIAACKSAQLNIDVASYVSFKSSANYPLKLNIEIKNKTSNIVLVESAAFTCSAEAPASQKKPMLSNRTHIPAFLVGRRCVEG